MKILIAFFVSLVAVWSPGCGGSTPTPTPVPTPPEVTDAGQPPAKDSCEAECATLERLRCPEWSTTCDVDCARLDTKLLAIHSAQQNHSCIALATTCATAKTCRP